MRLTRFGLTGLVVVLLALLGTACGPTPTPQMQLTISLDQSARYEILTKAVAFDVTVTCTRPAKVELMSASLVVQGSGSVILSTRNLDPYYAPGNSFTVDCPGPAGQTETTWWHWTGDPPGTGGYTIWIFGTTGGLLGSPNTASARGAGTVHFSKILCWFGLSNPCVPV
jgi:hypothetical protein